MKLILHYLASAVMLAACANDSSRESAPAATKDSAASSGPVSPSETAQEPASKEAVDLRFNLQTGKVYDYAMDFTVNQEAQGRAMTTTMNWDYHMKVTGEEDGLKTIRATYKRIGMVVGMGDQKMEFSSDNAAGGSTDPMNIPGKMFGALKGKSFTMKVNAEGNVVSVDGFDQMSEAVVNEMKLSGAAREQMLGNLRSQFNDEVVRQMFGQSFHIFPGKPVKPGDSWTRKTVAGIGNAKSDLTTTYTLKEVRGDRVTIDARSGANANENASAAQTARFIISARTGLVLDGNFTQTMEGDRKLVGQGRIRGKEL